MSKVYNEAEKRELKKAIDVQGACNLSGVLHSWASAASVVREAVATNHGVAFNSHPINVLYASKVASLLGMNLDSLGGVEGSREKDADPIDLAFWAFGEAKRAVEEKEETLCAICGQRVNNGPCYHGATP